MNRQYVVLDGFTVSAVIVFFWPATAEEILCLPALSAVNVELGPVTAEEIDENLIRKPANRLAEHINGCILYFFSGKCSYEGVYR